jgi:hypothetical protein
LEGGLGRTRLLLDAERLEQRGTIQSVSGRMRLHHRKEKKETEQKERKKQMRDIPGAAWHDAECQWKDEEKTFHVRCSSH